MYPTNVWPKKTQPDVVAGTPNADDVDEVIKTPSVLLQDFDLPVEDLLKALHVRSASVLSDLSTDTDNVGFSALTDIGEEADWGDTDLDLELVQDD